MLRTCQQCKKSKPVQDYHQQPRRCKSKCVACLNQNAKHRRKINSQIDHDTPEFKRCANCAEDLPGLDFAVNRTSGDGLACWCKRCYRQKSAGYKQNRRLDAVVCNTCHQKVEAGDISAENTAKCKACVAQRKRARWEQDDAYKLKEACRNRIRSAIKRMKGKKQDTSIDLLGCSWNTLKSHLESGFLEGMSWDNHGLYGWHIDHVRPCASFDLSDLRQQQECFHFTNLQPLWARDNLSKGQKYSFLVDCALPSTCTTDRDTIN